MSEQTPTPANAGWPLVTIVTPTFNQAEFLERTLQSVLSQDYQSLECIVVDGASTDGTAAILARYSDRIRVISEPDRGQADAINKGFRLAQGSILGWLNSDDLLLPGAISAVVRYFMANPAAQFAYGDALAIDGHDRIYGLRAHVRQTDHADLVSNGDFIVQPAAFWQAALWREVGELDTSLHYTLDYDYWLRASLHTNLRYIPVCLAAERLHEAAKTAKGSRERIAEIEQLARRYGGDGLPSSFRAQAAAQLTVEGLLGLLRFDKDGRASLRTARALHPGLGVYLRYLLVMLLAGERSVARFWLLINPLRQRRKADVALPADYRPAQG